MGLQKQNIDLSFYKGDDTKTDPFRVQFGNFLSLKNSVFDDLGRLTKRNGFGSLGVNPSNSPILLSSFKGNLIAAGTTVSSYSAPAAAWLNKGTHAPVSISATGLIRNTLNQSQVDSYVAPNGLVCVAYSQTQDFITFTYQYSILEVATGQTIVAPVAISATSAPRVFVLGSYFIVVYGGSGNTLNYVAINTTTLVANAPVQITNSYTAAANFSAFDGVVATSLYLAWNGASASGIKMASLSTGLVLSSIANPDPANPAEVVGVTADTSGGTPVIWVMYQGATGDGFVFAVTNLLVLLPAFSSPVDFSSDSIVNVTGYANAGVCSIFWEASGVESYDSTLPVNRIIAAQVTNGGSLTSLGTICRQNGLASKAFFFNSKLCLVSSYSTASQPSYFLLNVTNFSNPPPVLAKFAYQNGGGYLTNGLPNVTSLNGSFYLPYLFKDLVEAVNKETNQTSTATNPISPGGIYSQTGINILTLSISTTANAVELGNNLNLTNGYLSAYDGTAVSENNFFLWPDLRLNADGTYKGISSYNSAITPTATTTSGSAIITNVSALTGIAVGQSVSGTGIQAGTTVLAISQSPASVRLSLPATSSGSGRTMTFTGNLTAQKYFYVFTYEWTDNQGNVFRSAPSTPVSITVGAGSSSVDVTVPNLPLTNKSVTSIKIVGYRYSAGQQEYFQFTSISYPILNSNSNDNVTITDSTPDSLILGNNLIYTTGGVVEDASPPATNLLAAFDTRLWLVDAEDTNLMWYSKPLVEGTPVEMSQELTYYVPPIIEDEGSAGGLTSFFPMDDKLILFRKSSVSYINGSGPDSTGANGQYSQPINVPSSVGCSNQNSIVMTPQGLIFQSQEGFWLLDRNLNPDYIGAPVEEFNQYNCTSAVAVPGTTQVRFSMSNGQILMYDHFAKQWGQFDGVSAVSSTIYNSLHTILDGSGNVFQETPGTYLDGSTPVVMSFVTSWLSLSGIQGFLRAYWAFFLGTYVSPYKLTVDIAYDYDSTSQQTIVITPDPTLSIAQEQLNFQRQTCQAFRLTVQEQYDSTVGPPAGQGLTLTGLNFVYGAKKGYPQNLPASRKTG